MIILIDDGTLDTVLECTDCRRDMRYNFSNDAIDDITYDDWVDEIIMSEAEDHRCDE